MVLLTQAQQMSYQLFSAELLLLPCHPKMQQSLSPSAKPPMEILSSVRFWTGSVGSCNMSSVWLFKEWINSNCNCIYWFFIFLNFFFVSVIIHQFVSWCFSNYSLFFFPSTELRALPLCPISCVPCLRSLVGSYLLTIIKSRIIQTIHDMWWSCAVFSQHLGHWDRFKGTMKTDIRNNIIPLLMQSFKLCSPNRKWQAVIFKIMCVPSAGIG